MIVEYLRERGIIQYGYADVACVQIKFLYDLDVNRLKYACDRVKVNVVRSSIQTYF